MKKLVVLTACVFVSAFLFSCKGDPGPAGDPSLGILSTSFQDGIFPYSSYAGTQDAYMSSLNSTTSYETITPLNTGNNSASEITRGIIKFDLTSVAPQNIIVKKAYLTLYNILNSGVMPTVAAYKVTRYWDTDVRWDRSVIGLAWAGGEGSYSVTASSDSVTMDTESTVLTLSLDTAMVQDWILYSITNYGIIIKAANEGTAVYNRIQYNSSEAANAATRPKLTIYYTLP